MNAHVEILVADLADVLQVPMQSIQQSGGKAFAYVDRNGSPEVVAVELGLNNDRAVVVKTGLNEGDQVYLSLPANAPALPVPEGQKQRPTPDEPSAAADAAPAAAGAATGGPSDAPAVAPANTGSQQGMGGPGGGMGRRPRGERPARPKDP
jgi:hypothetical protein